MLPFFLSLGMTLKEYWEEDAYLTQIYYKLQDLNNQRKNEELWLQGAYFYNAMTVVMHNAFRQKGQQGETYLAEPFDILPKKPDVKAERDKVVDFFTNLQDSWDKKHG